MAYELFGHPEVPEWMKRPTLLPVVCLLTASTGLVVHHFIHANVVAVMITFFCSVGILRFFDLHMPPALAVGLLPFVIPVPDYRFPLSVLLGTMCLGLYFFGYKRLRQQRPRETSVIENAHRTK
jgi:CBS-domain-containing membrane protein